MHDGRLSSDGADYTSLETEGYIRPSSILKSRDPFGWAGFAGAKSHRGAGSILFTFVNVSAALFCDDQRFMEPLRPVNPFRASRDEEVRGQVAE